ncbi:MAG: hypothetical protein V8S92_01595, partial [Oscillospiraceae bacterium]
MDNVHHGGDFILILFELLEIGIFSVEMYAHHVGIIALDDELLVSRSTSCPERHGNTGDDEQATVEEQDITL